MCTVARPDLALRLDGAQRAVLRELLYLFLGDAADAQRDAAWQADPDSAVADSRQGAVHVRCAALARDTRLWRAARDSASGRQAAFAPLAASLAPTLARLARLRAAQLGAALRRASQCAEAETLAGALVERARARLAAFWRSLPAQTVRDLAPFRAAGGIDRRLVTPPLLWPASTPIVVIRAQRVYFADYGLPYSVTKLEHMREQLQALLDERAVPDAQFVLDTRSMPEPFFERAAGARRLVHPDVARRTNLTAPPVFSLAKTLPDSERQFDGIILHPNPYFRKHTKWDRTVALMRSAAERYPLEQRIGKCFYRGKSHPIYFNATLPRTELALATLDHPDLFDVSFFNDIAWKDWLERGLIDERTAQRLRRVRQNEEQIAREEFAQWKILLSMPGAPPICACIVPVHVSHYRRRQRAILLARFADTVAARRRRVDLGQ